MANWITRARSAVGSWGVRSVPEREAPHRAVARPVDTLAEQVLQRLHEANELMVVVDPHREVLSLAAQLDEQWRVVQDPLLAQAMPLSDEQLAFLKSEVGRLPPQRREVLLLHTGSSLNFRQIAAQLGLEPSAVLRELRIAYSALCMKSGD